MTVEYARYGTIFRFFGVTTAFLACLTPLGRAEENTAATTACALSIGRLRCEYLQDPLGIDVREPRLSWIVQSEQRGEKQSAYQILVASSPELLESDTGDLWDTGRLESDETVLIPYQGKPLASRTACWWKVRVWDRQGRVSGWCEPAFWTVGLLEPSDWDAQWIGQPAETFPEQSDAPAPLFRKPFKLEAKPARATAYIAAMGYYELHLNGERIGDDVCSPPVSDYNRRAYYVTYDVTDAVKKGKNCLGVWLGRGWYCPEFPGVTHPGPIVRVQLEIVLDNGEIRRVVSGDTWKTYPSPVTALGNVRRGNLDGEEYDARREVPGWDTAKYKDPAWSPAAVIPRPDVTLSAMMMDPNRFTETITPVSVDEIAPGEYLFDLGRNITGMFELSLRGRPNLPVSLSFIERKDATTGKWVDYGQQARYVPRTTRREVFRDRFMYHAFRYVRVKGLRRPPKLQDATARFVQTDFVDRGSFKCSNDLFNRIYDMTLYTFRCVTAGGVSVDCPHRERLGYGGDGQITSRSALYAFDLGALYTKWLGNWRDVQNPQTGGLPNIAPSPHNAGGGPTWGAISVFLPWDLYLHYGDRRVLSENYAMMKQYIAFLDSKSEDHQLKPYGSPEYGFLGDWVAPGHDQGVGPWSPEEWRTFFNNCFYALIVDYMAKVASVLGQAQDAARYTEQAARIRRITHEKYFKPQENSYVDGGQAYLAIALLSGVTPAELRPAVTKRLENTIIHTNQGHLDTGMHGTMFLLRCLNDLNRDDLAFLITNQKTYPGWGYMIEQGATTFWERWDGERSQIHSTLLAAGEWFPRALGGIKPDETLPGFKRVIIDPRPVGGLTWARTAYDTVRGPVCSEWRIDGDRFHLDIEIPANTTAVLRLPARNPDSVTENGRPAVESEFAKLLRTEPDYAVFEVDSGKYAFVSAR